MSNATTNRAAVMTTVGAIEVTERPLPEAGPGEVLVGIHTVTLCGSDIHYFEHGRIADFVVDGPIVLGHEASGTIVGLGAGVDPARLGQRVALEPGISCRTCSYCLNGRYNLCPFMAFYATPPHDGALQAYVALPAYLAHEVPEHLAFEHAALIEPLAVAVQACRRADLQGGERVLIAGAGAIGLLCAQVAASMGAAEVVVADTDSKRVDVANAGFGVHAVLAGDVRGSFDRFIECSGAHAALVAGIGMLAPGTSAVLVGMGQQDLSELPLGWMLVNEISLLTTFRYANAYPAAIALAGSGQLRLDGLIGARFPLDETAAAFGGAQSDKTILRSAIRIQEQAEELHCVD
ncbi:NAD(P)-dependent alcohol dehydrogenase [Arthrobacter ginkgonis]|uniref:NAD(P)-dependent alcohol dehydrogenase n=1 Tax=Arthrobacter ginkgonis TaxID=1630594 RepID=A0ABP7D2G1_9MICC